MYTTAMTKGPPPITMLHTDAIYVCISVLDAAAQNAKRRRAVVDQ